MALSVDHNVCVLQRQNELNAVSGSSSNRFEQFVSDPLLFLSKLYSAATSQATRTGHNPPLESDHEEEEEEEEPQSPSSPEPEAAANQFHLHETAENCLSSLRAGTASILLYQGAESGEGLHFLNLPVGVHLHIFSFLDAPSLCRLASTCGYMSSLTSDPLLWQSMLRRDVATWRVIGHLSHPRLYQDASSDFTPKQIYCRCCQQRTALPRQAFTRPLTSRLRSLVRRVQGHIPRVLMFGSGLESVPLVRTLLWEDASPYRPIGLHPGKDGIGSGVCIQHRNTPVNLITLYTSTKAERQAAASGTISRVNKLVSSYSEGEGPELTQAVQELCQQSDALILAVDSSKTEGEALELDLAMLQAMLHSGTRHTALLVLSCQLQPHSPGSSPLEVANRLNLCNLTHPWQVRSLVLETYEGLQDGIDWLLGAACI